MLFLLLIAAVFANKFHELPVEKAWQLWQRKYASTDLYGVELDESSYKQFQYNYAIVTTHNSMNDTSFWLDLNEYAAISNDEFQQRNGFWGHIEREPTDAEVYTMSGVELPASVDWRGKLVTPVKNQGECGSCWTFSAVVALEGQYAKLTETLLELSEQDLVDCVKDQTLPGSSDTCCFGCEGGLMDYAFQHIKDNQNGVHATESAYPYTGTDSGACAFSRTKAFNDAKVTGFVDLNSEDEMQDALANVGPISVAVNANIFWQLYGGGVLNPVSCPPRLDHGVAVVGYGTDGDDYWIIKNSWGDTWGEEGFMRLVRGTNACGIANGPPSYPTMTA